jgi:hypothetical protein
MNIQSLIRIQEYRVHLPPKLFPYQGKHLLQVKHVKDIASGDSGWVRVSDLGSDFFRPAFDKRNPLNMPGPFYGAETDTCATGPPEAPNNVFLDRNGQEFVFKQPANCAELGNILVAALIECFGGYGADGDDHWTLTLIREWWRSRHDLLAHTGELSGSPDSVLSWRRLLSGDAENYLRAYAFFVEEGRDPKDTDLLPDVG